MKNLPHFLQWFLGILLALALFWTVGGLAAAQSVGVKSARDMTPKPMSQKKDAAKQALPKLAPVKQPASTKGEPEPIPARLMGVEEALGPEALAIAGKVHTGLLSCELGAIIKLEGDPAMPGYFNMSGRNFFFRMVPVVSSTGAIRLEDRQTGGLWLQLPHKSMLMNQTAGQRMADDCMSPIQASLAQHMKLNPGPNLLEAIAPAPDPAGGSILMQGTLNAGLELPKSIASAPDPAGGPIRTQGTLNAGPELPESIASAPDPAGGTSLTQSNLNPGPELPASVAPVADLAEVPVLKQGSTLCRIFSSSFFRFPRFCF